MNLSFSNFSIVVSAFVLFDLVVVPKRSFGARVAVPKSERSAASFARLRVSWIVASRTKENFYFDALHFVFI